MAKAKENEKALARELYMQTGMTIKEIAGIAQVNRATVGEWATSENWEAIKKAQQHSPDKLIQAYYAELDELNAHIQAKEKGKRFADSKESDARNKIIISIMRLKNQTSLPQYVAVMIKFMEVLQSKSLKLSKEVAPLANEFLNDMAAAIIQTQD